ncbi:MAG TPA: response regulator [Thermoanaerobaculia bacterium]|nr:response regulator [Thermoanaerobaculia bacterium]
MARARRRILIVDDDPNDRALIAATLRLRGMSDVESVRGGAEALHQLATESYALVILDVVMPFMTGIDLLESLYALRSGVTGKRQELPRIIVLTSCTETDLPSEQILNRYEGCVRAVLRKPTSVRELSDAAARHVAS